MSNFVRLSDRIALEFGGNTRYNLSETGLYLYKHPNTYLLLNGDAFDGNNRNRSYDPMDQNILLRTTPEPYVPELTHCSYSIEALPEFKKFIGLSPNFINLRVLFAAGFQYADNVWGIGYAVFVRDKFGKKIYLCAQYDEKTDSHISVIADYYTFENVIFNQGFELQIIDLQDLLKSNEDDVKEFVEKIFGPGYQFLEYEIEFFEILEDEVAHFGIGNRFTKLEPQEVYTQYYKGEDNLMEICNSIVVNEDHSVMLSMQYPGFNIEAYLKRICGNTGEGFFVTHQLDIMPYEANATEPLGIWSTSYSNTLSTFSNIYVRPYLDAETLEKPISEVLLRLTSTFRDSQSGLTFARQTRKVLTNLELFETSPIQISATQLEIKNVVTRHENRIVTKSDVPTIRTVQVNNYYERVSTTEITLTPHKNVIAFDLSIMEASDSYYLCIGDNRYPGVVLDSRNPRLVTFTVPSDEYYKDTKQYYITNESDSVISSGSIRYE